MTHENDSKPRNQPTVVEDRRERAQTDKVRYSTHVDWTLTGISVHGDFSGAFIDIWRGPNCDIARVKISARVFGDDIRKMAICRGEKVKTAIWRG